MSARTARYVTSDFGSADQLVQDLRSELLVEKQKRFIAENRADDLAKQLKELQELSRFELVREADRRRDAEKRNHDLEKQLHKAETEKRKKETNETSSSSREQPLLRRGNSTLLLPVDRTHAGRNVDGTEQVENDRMRIAGTDGGYRIGNESILKRISSLNHHNLYNDSSTSSNYYSQKDDDMDDEEWQFIVRHNARIIQKSGRASGKLSRKSNRERHNQQKSKSAFKEGRNIITHFTHHDDESQGNHAVTHEPKIVRVGSVRERTKSLGQVSIAGQSGGESGLVWVTHEQASTREGKGNTRGAEHISKAVSDDNGIASGAERASTKGRSSKWPSSERSEDHESRRPAKRIDGSGEYLSRGRVNETSKLLVKTVQETEQREVPKEIPQDSVTTIITHKDASDVTHSSDSVSSLSMKTVTYADPAFNTRQQRKIFWEQKASVGQTTEPRVPSPAVDKAPEETHETVVSTKVIQLPVQGIMRLRAKWEITPSYSEA